MFFFQGPFEMLKYECEGDFEWTHLKFSPNGKMILVSTNTSLILLVDAFSGVLLHTFTVRNLVLINGFHRISFRDIKTAKISLWKRHLVLIPNTSSVVCFYQSNANFVQWFWYFRFN